MSESIRVVVLVVLLLVAPLVSTRLLVLGVLLTIRTFTLPTTRTTLLTRLELMTLLGRRLPILVQARQFRLPLWAIRSPSRDRGPRLTRWHLYPPYEAGAG